MPWRDDYADYDDHPSGRGGGAEFPTGVRAAGIIWIVFGVLVLVATVVLVVVVAAQIGLGGARVSCAPVCLTLFAVVFLLTGIQTVKGTAKSTLGNGIGSIIFGVLFLGSGAVGFAIGARSGTAFNVIRGGVEVLFGVALLVAGTLALIGKSQYEEWRAAQGFARKRRQTQEERDYDEDDRPRRDRDDDDR